MSIVQKLTDIKKAHGSTIERAREEWKDKANARFLLEGDRGPVAYGDGIKIWCIPPRARSPRWVMLIPSTDVAKCQGTFHYEGTVDFALDILKDAGLTVRYDHGRLD